jgi:hypothetical protein
LDGTKILNYGLHEFIDEIQQAIIEIDTSIAEAFFGAGHRELAEIS